MKYVSLSTSSSTCVESSEKEKKKQFQEPIGLFPIAMKKRKKKWIVHSRWTRKDGEGS